MLFFICGSINVQIDSFAADARGIRTVMQKYTKTFLNKFVYSSIFGRIFASKKGLNDI